MFHNITNIFILQIPKIFYDSWVYQIGLHIPLYEHFSELKIVFFGLCFYFDIHHYLIANVLLLH